MMTFHKNKIYKGFEKICVVATACAMLLTGCTTGSNDGANNNSVGGNGTDTISFDDGSINSMLDTPDGGLIRSELTALEVTGLMGNGINLGNTMEAYGHTSLGTGAEVSSYETLWGQPVTTQESILGMKEAGFDTLRIPVAWTNVMNYEDGDYTIRADYLDRIEEIVGYARNADMYVIINDHWDGGWWGMFGSASAETRQAARDLYTSMWSQIAQRFRDYSDYVIFESGNEEIGSRLNDTDAPLTKDSGTLSEEDCYLVAAEINQLFVDTVRATGGNNAERFLLIAGYGTDISATCNAKFVMPTDTVDNKLLISVHFYDPSGYCIFTSLDSWGSQDDYEDMNRMLRKLQYYTGIGVGVVIGEYGVLIENQSEIKNGTIEYLTNFLDNCDLYGYCPVLWDCNNQYNRSTCKMNFDDVAQLYLERSYKVQSSKTDTEIAEAARTSMEASLAAADAGYVLPDDSAIAWIMYTSSDWGTQYCVGDVYDPTTKSGGVVATDAEITGEGTYTVALDMSGTANGYGLGITFCAVGLANGEKLYPGYCIEITEVKINGEAIVLQGDYYTTSDNQICTRVNLYNSWVSAVPAEARRADGKLDNASACPVDAEKVNNVVSIEVTFVYVKP